MKKLLLKLLICIIFIGNIFAQDIRIGLVLGGGGAKGISHIGILKAFEEYQIPIYCITGASAGALVGGLYVSGMSIKKMEEISKSGELDDIFNNKINDNDIPIEYRLNNLPRQINLFIDKDEKKIIKPFGLFNDQRINDFISYWTMPGNCQSNSNFDSLAIPFRCVGADIVNRESVVFSEGSLAKAMRASMAYPIVFEPVIMDSTIMADGGLYDNLPIEVAINMGANYIVAVNVSDVPPKQNEIKDISSMTNYLSNILAARSDSEYVENYDEFIQIDNSDISLFDFSTGDTTIKRGYEKGKVLAKKLTKIVNTNRDINSFHQKQNRYRNYFKDKKRWKLIIKGNKKFTKNQITTMMALNKNIMFDYDDFHSGIQRLYFTGYFNSVDFNIANDQLNNELIVTIDLKENEKIELRGGFYFDSNAGMNMYASIFNNRIKNTSLILKNYLFVGNYHNGLKSSISILNLYKVPMAKLRYSLSLSPSFHRYLYKGNIYGISNIYKTIYKFDVIASASLGWDRKVDLYLCGKGGSYSDTKNNISKYMANYNYNKPYTYIGFSYNYIKDSELHPTIIGSRIEINSQIGQKIDKLGKFDTFEKDSYLKIDIQGEFGKKLTNAFRIYGNFKYGKIYGNAPLLEYLIQDQPQYLQYEIGEEFFADNTWSGLVGVCNKFLFNDLWLKLQFFIRESHHINVNDTNIFSNTSQIGSEVFLVYETPIGPISYGVSILNNDNYTPISWARIGLEF